MVQAGQLSQAWRSSRAEAEGRWSFDLRGIGSLRVVLAVLLAVSAFGPVEVEREVPLRRAGAGGGYVEGISVL